MSFFPKRNQASAIALLLAIWLSIPALIFAQKEEPLDSITREELRDLIFFLASDELKGRETGSEGYAIAALYAVTQFKKLGLVPLIVGSDGKKGFDQPVPFLSYDVNRQSALSISSSAGEIKLFHPEKMVLYSCSPANNDLFRDEKPAFLGYGIDDPEIGWSDYTGVDVRGRVVIVFGGAPSKDGHAVFPPDKDDFYRNFGRSANIRIIWAMEHGASHFIYVPDPAMIKSWPIAVERMIKRQFNVRLNDDRKASFPSIIFMHPDAAREMLKNAGIAWTYGGDDYKPAVLENIKVSCSVEKDNVKEIACKNVVAVLPGTDPRLKEEYIVVHAHLDHLGIDSDGEVNNGADDDASGCAAVLEIAEALAMKPAKRSFIFVLFTGEEEGTLGSDWFINNLPIRRRQIVLSAAVDMVGRKSNQKPDVIFVTAKGPDTRGLLDIAKSANESRIRADIDFSLNQMDFDGHLMRCDLRPFIDNDIASLLFTRGFMGPNYHSPDDDAGTLNYDKIEKASRLLYLVLDDVGNRSE